VPSAISGDRQGPAVTPSRRRWRGYGTEPLPTGPEALEEPMAAFPSWFLRIECDRCGKVRMIAETHLPAPDAMMLRDILHRMRHDGCGGRAGNAELLTGIEGVPRRRLRKIVLVG
jgi:hypothetical protein